MAVPLLWILTVAEIANGAAHLVWSIWQRGYTPGVATAPRLLILALLLARQLVRRPATFQ